LSRLYLFSLLLILLALGACNSGASSQKKVAQDSEITVPVKEVVMEGLKRPWSMAFLSEDEALVAEKDGDLLMINLETKSRKVIDGFPDDLADSLLINVAKHPDGFIYPMFLRETNSLQRRSYVPSLRTTNWKTYKPYYWHYLMQTGYFILVVVWYLERMMV